MGRKSMSPALLSHRFPFPGAFSVPRLATASTSQKTHQSLSSICFLICLLSAPCAMTDTCMTSVSITISPHSLARMSRTLHGSAKSDADSIPGSDTSACSNP